MKVLGRHPKPWRKANGGKTATVYSREYTDGFIVLYFVTVIQSTLVAPHPRSNHAEFALSKSIRKRMLFITHLSNAFYTWLGIWRRVSTPGLEMDPEVFNVSRSTVKCKTHQTPKFLSSRLAVAIGQSIEARCQVEHEDVVGATPTGNAPKHLSDEQFYCLLRCVFY